MGAWPRLSNEALVLIGFCDQLLGLLDREVFVKPVPGGTQFQKAMALILAKARDDARAATRLATAGYGPQSAGLCRSVVEASINSHFIKKEPEIRADAFLKSINSANKLLSKRLAAHPVPPDVQQAIDEAARIEKDSNWPRSIMQRAYDVQNPNYSYDVVFLLLSQQIHSDVAAMAGQVAIGDQSQFIIRIGRGNDWITQSAATVFIYLGQVIDAAYDAFNFDKSALNSLFKDFEKAHHSGLLPTRG
jgi:hypothetical protein